MIVLNILILHFHYIEEHYMHICYKNKCSAWRCLLVLHWWKNILGESNRFLKKCDSFKFKAFSCSFFSPLTYHLYKLSAFILFSSLLQAFERVFCLFVLLFFHHSSFGLLVPNCLGSPFSHFPYFFLSKEPDCLHTFQMLQ